MMSTVDAAASGAGDMNSNDDAGGVRGGGGGARGTSPLGGGSSSKDPASDEEQPDYYAVLGLTVGASAGEIKVCCTLCITNYCCATYRYCSRMYIPRI